MLTAIVVDDTGSLATLSDKVETLLDHSLVGDIKVISTADAPEGFGRASWIKGESLIQALEQAITETPSKRMLIVSSALTFQGTDLARFVAEIENTPTVEHLCAITATERGAIELPDITPDGFISTISNTEVWPFFCVATTRSACRAAVGSGATSVIEFITHALVRAVGDGDAVRPATTIIAAMPNLTANSLGDLSAAARARCLSVAADAMNIEELFPNHPWSDFSQESAAAAYHSLAALFLRFGDADSAIQALECSEQLEESPRYFALKGLIQQARGETLEAVANLVTSLQCYETRKAKTDEHYLSFQPRNLEVINSRLVDGLNALNTRDNAKAVTHFSEAVFNFDGFYAEYGVEGITKSLKA